MGKLLFNPKNNFYSWLNDHRLRSWGYFFSTHNVLLHLKGNKSDRYQSAKKKKKISSTCTNPVRLISLPLTVVLELKLSSVLAAFRRLNQNMSQVQKRLVTITYFTLSTYNLPQQIKQPTESLPQSVTVRSALNELG